MPPIIVSTDIDRSATDVFSYATDPARFSEWQKGVVEGHIEGGDTQRLGARCGTTRRVGFASRPVRAEITEIDPPRTWSVRGIDGPIRAAVDLLVESLDDDRSRITISVDFQGFGIGKVLVPLMVRREARREMPANLATLKARLQPKGS
jgi:uncharacterized protein YndB with AHSA1/START domain